jgi:hypothetical protein
MEQELQAQRERIVANQNALFNEEAAAIKQHYDNYFENMKALADLYGHAETPEQIARVSELADKIEQHENQWDQQQEQRYQQESDREELEGYHQQVLDQLSDLQDKLDKLSH